MAHHDTPGQPMDMHTEMPGDHHEMPGDHHAPDPPLIDPHVFATMWRLLESLTTKGHVLQPTSAEVALDRIEQHFKMLEWMTDLSRRAIYARDRSAVRLLASWFKSHGHQVMVDQKPDGGHGQTIGIVSERIRPDMGHPDEISVGGLQDSGAESSLGLNVRAIRELFLGAVYASGSDEALLTRSLDLVQTTLAHSIGLLDVLHHYATLSLNGIEQLETLPNLLGMLPTGDYLTDILFGNPLPPEFPWLPPELGSNPFLECLETLRGGTVGAGSAFGVVKDAILDPAKLTGLIASVTPASVCTGTVVTIHSGAGQQEKFPKNRPPDYGVFFEPCDVPGLIMQWEPDYVTVQVPEQASSGCITFGQDTGRREAAAAAQAAEAQAMLNFAACLGHFGRMPPASFDTMLLDTTKLCFTLCQPGDPNYVQVRHKPEIISLVARDPLGREVGTDGVEAGTPVTISWAVRSDDSAPLQITLSGAKTLAGLPPVGSLTLSSQDMRTQQSLALNAANSCATTTRHVTIAVFRKLYLSPIPLGFKIDETGTLTIRSSCPVSGNVTVTLAPSNPDGLANPPRVTIPSTATIPAGQDSVTVAVVPAIAGDENAYVASLIHSQPAAVISVTAPSHASAAVGVWIEPPRGQSKVVTPPDNVVAVHMAVLRSGKVLMFSADDADFGNTNKVKTRVWDPVTNTVVTPSFPYATNKNLFCAGHCILADGRVLVVGGHAIFAGGSAASQVHTFDPISNSWSRHAPMQQDRWYPTCVTMADGRVLIASGSDAGGKPTGWSQFWGKGIVSAVEIFDPATNGLTHFPNIFGADICMYPNMFVLPGGLLFFHSRNISRLIVPGEGTWSPPNFRWSKAIPMKGDTTRNFPGMSGCVILPLLPEEGYAVRVLIAGGGGKKESDLNVNTTATQTAEIFGDIDAHEITGTWRDTNRAGEPLRMTTNRFMTDAVLLPDGTVLFVNGCAVGMADESHVSIGFAELFDPQTETFRPFTRISMPRHYHGTALLLPDGRVAVAGHTKEWNTEIPLDRKEVEVISPPYLFRGPRPKITQVAHSGAMIGYGQDVTIYTDRSADISRVALLRPGSVTHQLNTDQRYVGLAITQRSSGTVTVTAPPDGAVAPPGYSLLFIVDNQGVPSLGQSVRIG